MTEIGYIYFKCFSALPTGNYQNMDLEFRNIITAKLQRGEVIFLKSVTYIYIELQIMVLCVTYKDVLVGKGRTKRNNAINTRVMYIYWQTRQLISRIQ